MTDRQALLKKCEVSILEIESTLKGISEELKALKEPAPVKVPTVVGNYVVDPRQVRYQHIRFGENGNKHAVTLAYVRDFEHNLVRVGIAICNGDDFVRAIGRTQAIKHLMDKGSRLTFMYDPDYTIQTQIRKVLKLSTITSTRDWINAYRKYLSTPN